MVRMALPVQTAEKIFIRGVGNMRTLEQVVEDYLYPEYTSSERALLHQEMKAALEARKQDFKTQNENYN